MKFSKLRIVGFKTFVEPTEILIEPGLTGVVGPNGCGKSNLVEALRWVMGESSSKSMRANDMDDVIFSGSTRRPARNRAEVSVTLDNAEKLAPAGFNDADVLEVSRRIERQQGSSYRINGRDVRARDVQLLFADASTGARSPAMVGQGRIGELIAAKPAARRRLLEEAAGVSGLHSRRHEAELRLKAAEQNLERVEDLVNEIGVQLENLKRQARQAARYRALSGEIRKAEATLLHLRWIAARTQGAEAEAALAEATALAEARASAQANAAKDQAVAAAAVPGLRDAEAAAGAALERLRVAAEQLADEERRSKQRLVELERRLIEIADDLAREQRLTATAVAESEALDAEAAELSAETEMAAERAAELEREAEAADSVLAAAEAAFTRATEQAAQAAARRGAAERAVQAAGDALSRLEREVADLARERGALERKLAAEDGREDARFALEAAEEALAVAETLAAEAEATLQAARAAEAEARPPARGADEAVSRLETEAKTLAKILAAGTASRFVPVVDAIVVAPGFEAALAAALGDDLDASEEMTAPLRWAGAVIAADDPALPAGVTPLAAHVTAPAALARRLAQIGLVERADGARLASLLKAGQRLVSREGDLWRWDGFVSSAEAPSAAAQRLAQRNRLAELERDLAVATETRARCRMALAAAEAAVAASVADERAKREAIRERQRAIAAARDGLGRAERAVEETTRRLSALADVIERRAEDLAAAAAAREEALMALEEAAGLDDSASEIATLRLAVAEARARATEVRALVGASARENEMRVRRLSSIARDREAVRARADDAARRAENHAERRAEIEAERDRLAAAPDDFHERQRALAHAIAKAEGDLAAASDARLRGEAVLNEADGAARSALTAFSEAREAKARAEERLTAVRARRAELEEQIADALDCPPHEAAAIAGLDPDAPLPATNSVEARLDRLKGERERLGGVNLRAEAEAEEVEARRDGLVSDRDDLIEAIKRLRQGISTLNGEARERLLAAFEAVDTRFRELFTHLFQGGEAELALVEADDPLEAGLEIVARPPGKKPQTLTLLSGGEQALTTLALIFAVFLTNPAPICVLDEVDAPLDDANVERFCDLVVEMTRRTDTRFLVITHNPITMARMHRLFGVTMVERGVSQVVSVDLETAERFREAS